VKSLTASTPAFSLFCPPGSAFLAKYPVRLKLGLDGTWTMFLSWILIVFPGINSQPSLIQSVSVHSIQFLLTRSNPLLILGHDQSMQSSRRG
jgi:hypothetical protein